MLLPNLPPPVEGIRHQVSGVDAYIKQRCLGTGVLYIAESHLSWNKENTTEGLSLSYPHIAVHAISTDRNSFQHPCLYIMLDVNLDLSANSNGHNESDDSTNEEEEEDSAMTEIRFVPRDSALLNDMYRSLSDCQALHPDPEQESDDGFDEGAEEEEEENNMEGEGGEDGQDDEMETGQFEDAH